MNAVAVLLLAIPAAAAEADDTRPPASDALRFGRSREDCRYWRCWWHRRAVALGAHADCRIHLLPVLQPMIEHARQCEAAWDMLDDSLPRDCQPEAWSINGRRDVLDRLRGLLGAPAFYAGEMPLPD